MRVASAGAFNLVDPSLETVDRRIDGQSYRLRELGALLSLTREPLRPADGRTT